MYTGPASLRTFIALVPVVKLVVETHLHRQHSQQQAVFADFFEESGHHYLVTGDRLSGWVEVYSPVESAKAGTKGLINRLRTMFTTFGLQNNLSSDGGPEFSASASYCFGVCITNKESVYCSQSDGRGEVAVKKAKRLLKTCIGPNGSLNHD